MKRFVAVLLCMAMVLSLAPVTAFAQEEDQSVTTVTAQEMPGVSRLEDIEVSEDEISLGYASDDMVTVIVELDEDGVLSGFEADYRSADAGSVGRQISEYMAREDVRQQMNDLAASQDRLIQTMEKELGISANVSDQWTGVVNAMAVTIPYGKLEEVRSLDGVRRAYVEKVYDRPIETLESDGIEGTYGYSYNQTNLSQVWAEGYTGQGMLVAVLDTGLDLTYASWGDSANLTTGIRRVHEAFTDDSFRNDPDDEENGWDLRYTDESLELFLDAAQLHANTSYTGNKIQYDNNALYKNRKVPFACDYADGDLNVQPSSSDHGTHVAGTIAGYVETSDGAVKFSGVAPDAQILAMKVFPDDTSDGGATESTIINALEDAMLLGADVVNLSLGSDNGFAEDDTAAASVYATMSAAGVMFMVSAGNSSTSSYMNNYDSYNLTSNPENSMISAPAVYDTSLAVASYNNTIESHSVLTWTDGEGTEHTVAYQDPNDVAVKYKLAGETVDLILVDGYGTYDDYYNAGFRGYYGYGDKGVSGVALVKRGGGISFTDKVNMATRFSWSYYDSAKGYYVTEFPIKAVIVYDEDPTATELIYMSVDDAGITSAFISGVDGAALAAACKASETNSVQITVEKEDVVSEAADGNLMSSFSSWGAGPALELKPEITAPGGNIWSAVVDQTYSASYDSEGYYTGYEGSYGMMSGTSMAAPHMTGIATLIAQAVTERYNLSTKIPVASLTQQLLVSTAVPQVDENGVYYSPRYQGAGLVNAGAALTSPAYISVDGQSVGKLELLDDPQRTGSYDIDFDVNNLTDEALTYSAQLVLMRPDTATVESEWGQREVMMENDVVIKTVDLGTVNVPAGGYTTVKQTVSLTDEEKAVLDENFENGIYVEGFVILTDANGENPQIGLPMLAFYGDWTAAPIFDSSLWYDEDECTWATSVVGSVIPNVGYVNLGQNLFDSSDGVQTTYCKENFTISPNGDGFLDTIDDFCLYQLREAKAVVVEVTDAETGELYYRDYATYQFKSLYDSSYGVAIPASEYYFTASDWSGTDLEGNVLPSGTVCTMTITAYGDGDYGDLVYDVDSGLTVTDFESIIPGENEPTFNGHEMDMTGDVISFPVTVDTVAPKLENNAVSFYEEDGRVYMTGTVYDEDGYIASIEVYPYVCRTYKEGYGDPSFMEYGMDKENPFLSENIYDPATKEWTFTADVTEYVRSGESYLDYYYDFTWTGNVYISCGDYGLNDRTYAVVADKSEGLVLSQSSALMHVGESFELSVNDNTGAEGEIVRESSNPEVATIDEFGHIEAISAGQTTITVRKGDQSAVCIVAVQEWNTEVVDFKLSVESFSGLKPNGTFVVKVTDLEPADVVLTEKIWDIREDDPDLYEGLITVAKYDSSGLSGEVYLNYTATSDPEIVCPGASATLSVTLNGVTRQMSIDWEDLYTYSNDDDLVSATNYGAQSIYVTQGETASLVAKYNDSSSHNVCDVLLLTAEGATNYSSSNSTDPAVGLVLDGADFSATDSTWTGKIVNEEGYALPENIRIFTRYDYGTYYYENEMINYSYYPYYTYDSTTGEIEILHTPYSETNDIVIRADGVVSEGNPAGELSGATYERPEPLYGPFDWEILEGTGELTAAENVEVGYETQNLAYYTPAEPGVSVIRATTKDGAYSVDFAVISEDLVPESLDVTTHYVTLTEGQTVCVDAVLSPEPVLDEHKQINWESFNPDVAYVDAETGEITANAEGYAYLRAYTGVQTDLETYLIVEVLACAHANTTTETVDATCTTDGSVTVTCEDCGKVISTTVLEAHHSYESAVTLPTCTEAGYTTHTCTVCGHSYVNEGVEALGHKYQHLVVEPTETQEGYVQHVCTVCGYTYRDQILEAKTCYAKDFTDVKLDAWYHEAVDFVVGEKLMNGVGGGLFDVNGTATRAQVVTVLYRLAGEPEVSGAVPFTDVPAGSYYYNAVAWAYSNGIAKGTGETTFAPSMEITREQLVTFLYRYSSPETQADVQVLDQFPDAKDVGEYAKEAFAWAVENELVLGSNGSLLPDGQATRVQMAAVLMRLCGLEQ